MPTKQVNIRTGRSPYSWFIFATKFTTYCKSPNSPIFPTSSRSFDSRFSLFAVFCGYINRELADLPVHIYFEVWTKSSARLSTLKINHHGNISSCRAREQIMNADWPAEISFRLFKSQMVSVQKFSRFQSFLVLVCERASCAKLHPPDPESLSNNTPDSSASSRV